MPSPWATQMPSTDPSMPWSMMEGLFNIFTVEKRDSNLPDRLWMNRGWSSSAMPRHGHPAQQRHELAAVAHAEAEGVGPMIEPLELVPDLFVEPDARRPSLRRIEHIGVAEPADEHHAAEPVERHACLRAGRSSSRPRARSPRGANAEAISRSPLLPSSRITATFGLSLRVEHGCTASAAA